jgi:hypothetical protein
LDHRLVLSNTVGVMAVLTADNHYALYAGQEDGSQLNLLGRNEPGEAGNPGAFNWTLPETWNFNVGEGTFIYVLAWDDGGPQMWTGQFTLSDGTSFYSDTTTWVSTVGTGPNPTAAGLPSLAAVASDIAAATWAAPQVSAPQGAGPWHPIPGLSPAAQLVWHDTFGDTSSSDNHYAIFRTALPLVPIVPNSPPSDLELTVSQATIDENGTVTLDGSFTDADADDSHTVVIDWGPGEQGSVLSLDAGVFSFQISHQYLDDNASGAPGTPSDTYPIGVTLSDSEGASSAAESSVTVENVAPVITSLQNGALGCGSAAPGESIHVSGAFGDVGTLDTHSAIIDWGDGTVTNGEVSGLAVAGQHPYSTGGIYTITLRVSDDDGGVSQSFTTTAMITGVALDHGVLAIVGTCHADHVTLNRQGNGWYKVHADFLPDRNFVRVPSAEVRRVVVALCGGDDHFHIAGNIRFARAGEREENPSLVDFILDEWQPPNDDE